ncbi:hypothetical protein LJC17_03175 [Acholeplasma sp. OttesenSCG-928-E16]|nr:hypothetical protein [Acholeplasma sp. OttesenSCG-928-E16]
MLFLYIGLGIVLVIVILLFLLSFLSFPRFNRKKEMEPFLIRKCAHRGLFNNSSNLVENSIPAILEAAKKGYSIEFDVRITKDDQIVIFHDNNLKRAANVDKKIADLTYLEIKEIKIFNSSCSIPLLLELLKLVPPNTPLIIEIKVEDRIEDTCRLVNEILSKCNNLFCIESFSPYVLKWFKKNNKKILRGQLASYSMHQKERTLRSRIFSSYLLNNYLGRPDFIAYHFNSKKPFTLKYLRKLKTPCIGWVIKKQEDIDNDKFYDNHIFDSFSPK